MEAPKRLAMTSPHMEELWRGPTGDGVPNVTHLGFNRGSEVVDEVRGSVAELLVGFGRRWCGDECRRARQSGQRQWWLSFPPRENEDGVK
jgi:hypothetical protein